MLSVKRKVRSAGRTSGSVEITLPPEMHALEGIECRLILCDGARPEIVIQPDISIAEVVFEDLWERLRIAFDQIGDIGPFTLSDFNISFLPPHHWNERPPLSYRDALAIYRAYHGQFQMDNSSLSHVTTFLAVGAAYRLGLTGRYALVFGVIVGYLVSGMSAGHGTDFEQDAVLRLFNGSDDPTQISLGALFKTEQWEQAQKGFKRIYEQVSIWQAAPDSYEAARRRWWEGLDGMSKRLSQGEEGL
jgi:hypothetical protein